MRVHATASHLFSIVEHMVDVIKISGPSPILGIPFALEIIVDGNSSADEKKYIGRKNYNEEKKNDCLKFFRTDCTFTNCHILTKLT